MIKTIVFIALLILPLSYYSNLVDPFIQVKHGLLQFLAILALYGLTRPKAIGVFVQKDSDKLILVFIFACLFIAKLFAIVALYFYFVQKKEDLDKEIDFLTYLTFFSSVLVALLGFKVLDLSSTFGSQTYASQFFCINLLIHYIFCLKQKKRWPIIFINLFMVGELLYLDLLKSRLIYLQLLLLIPFIHINFKIGVKKTALFFVLTGVYFSFFNRLNLLNEMSDLKTNIKEELSHKIESGISYDQFNFIKKQIPYRYEMWQSTLELLADNPWGIVQREFMFAIRPYQFKRLLISHNSLLHTPHNEYLNILVKLGVVPGILFIFFLFTKFFAAAKKNREKTTSLAIILYFMIESFFQDPTNNPYLMFLLCFSCARLSSNSNFMQIKNSKTFKTALASLIMFLSLKVAINFYSDHQEYTLNNVEFACKINPWRWQVCRREINALLFNGLFEKAREKTDRALKYSPENHFLIQKLVEIDIATGNRQSACARLKILEKRTVVDPAMIEYWCDE